MRQDGSSCWPGPLRLNEGVDLRSRGTRSTHTALSARVPALVPDWNPPCRHVLIVRTEVSHDAGEGGVMKWASLPLLGLALSLSSGESVVAQKLSPQKLPPNEQMRKRVNENVLFLMGGQPG